MAKIRIDLGELEMAFGSGDGTTSWFLDRETGAVIPLSDDFSIGEEEAVWDAINEGSDRYVEIPSLSSHQGFEVMEDFVFTLEPGPARDALENALRRHRPFRSFKDALFGFPDVRQAWFAFEAEHLKAEAEAWLSSEGIDAELVPVGGPPPG